VEEPGRSLGASKELLRRNLEAKISAPGTDASKLSSEPSAETIGVSPMPGKRASGRIK